MYKPEDLYCGGEWEIMAGIRYDDMNFHEMVFNCVTAYELLPLADGDYDFTTFV